MLRLFALAIFLSAALLFLVQPMVGKVLLPLLGGSPAVWNTCMVFFQAALLLGYGYAHVLTTRVPSRWQGVVHVGLLVVAGATLPSPVDVGEPGDARPEWWLLRTLLITVGLPFFVVSTTGPLMQKWFSRTDHPAARDPYFLYAASNAGSVVGLLAYPLAIEPWLTRSAQSLAWTAMFWVLAPLVGAGALLAARRAAPAKAAAAGPAREPVTWRRRALWVVLAAVPSSLVIGVTQHLSTDVAAIPLLWIIPLLLYLVTFILAFSGRWGWSAVGWGRLLAPLAVVMIVVMLTSAKNPAPVIVAIHLAAFFVAAMMCHRRLAEGRPDPAHLTEFYLCLSVGGVVGGIVNALAAPVLFREVVEYPLVLGLACLLRPQVGEVASGGGGPVRRGLVIAGELAAVLVLVAVVLAVDGASSIRQGDGPSLLVSAGPGRWLRGIGLSEETVVSVLRAGVPAALCAAALLGRGARRFALAATAMLVVSQWIGAGGLVLRRERTFFGVVQVVRNPAGTWHALYHGTTLHGQQAQTQVAELHPDGVTTLPLAERDRLFWGAGADAYTPEQALPWRHLIPSTYYHPSGPIGQVVRVMQREGRLERAALVGLGVGSLAAYARPGMRFDFFEIDPAVVELARDPSLFHYVSDAQKDPTVVFRGFVGDGRLGLRGATEPDGVTPAGYDLIVIDAFSSDAVPVHLITREALGVYLSRLRPGGVLAFHISSRYFDLSPVVARLAGDAGLSAWVMRDSTLTREMIGQGKTESNWAVLARRETDLGALIAHPTAWDRLGDDARYPLWTDDYSNLMRLFVGWGIPKKRADAATVGHGAP